ncbi:MAG: family 43 glycosylhydrolase [Bacteroidetes bacterium]|nr:family 43 glycosylhydrolase [Bacteroidota bacterium]
MKTLFSIFPFFLLLLNVEAQDVPEVTKYLQQIQFKYDKVVGIGHEEDCTRRDPSDIIKVENTWYIYYTKVFGRSSGYWGTLWYATSSDEGYTWEEQGEILGLGKARKFDSQATFTPNILKANNKYYLYYTGVKPTPGNAKDEFENNSTTDITAIGVAVAGSPNGPFIRASEKPILEVSSDPEKFDSYRVDDASLLYKDGKYWLYYKGRSRKHGKGGPGHTQMGVAFSINPEGPFTKYVQPILDRSHEVLIWPQGEGVAALASLSNTLEYAADGIDFLSDKLEIKVQKRPNAPGAFRPDLTNSITDEEGLSWGISMIHNGPEAYLMRFETVSETPVASTMKIEEKDANEDIIRKAAHVVPTPNQYAALQNEFIAFIHFGPNTFTRMEWGNGKEDPKIFNLQNLDTEQWCRAMKAAGMKMVIFTAKHHDGFCLWQSRYTKHGVMSSPFKDGKGDVLKELSESCRKYGLKLGVYLSPADLFQIENKEGLYGNLSKYSKRTIPRSVKGRPFANKTTFEFEVDDYNEYFLNQLFELLTEYGPIDEVWFDGAHPKRKGGQKYNYPAWKALIQKLAPKAVIFGRQDIRWCGNESGRTRDTEWNIIPYQDNPNEMNSFADITDESIGNQEDLYKGKYLHYQPAETNTSIREGWFYRDDTHQKVRNVDDVFDMYERSVGGNSIFLLNIPPNREGKFSPEDVSVLNEAGKRIQETYSNNLLEGAKGAKNILDMDAKSYQLLSEKNNTLLITTPQPITTNRLVIQEAITTHSERIEAHALDAWINDAWKEVASATSVGYKRILRFPEVTSSMFRIRILKTRFQPAISNVSAHYYKSRPPQLEITRDKSGMVSIAPQKHIFRWKLHGLDATANLNSEMEIRYTLDGSTPDKESSLYTESILVKSGEVKACTFDKSQAGSVTSTEFGILQKYWKLLNADSEQMKYGGQKAFDGDNDSYWRSKEKQKNNHFLSIDLGQAYSLKGFAYTPQTGNSEGMIEKGVIKISSNGKSWKVLESFEFGNLINDPSTRRHYFKTAVKTRYIRIQSKVIAAGAQTATIAEIDFLEAN